MKGKFPLMNKSRKIATILSVILLLNSIFLKTKAQNPSYYYLEEPKLFTGGLVAGVNLCQVDGDKYAGYFKSGVNAGAVLYARLNEKLSLSMELLFVQKGARSNFRQSSSSKIYTIVSQNINLNYAEIPVLIHLHDKRKSHVGLGLSYAQLISANENIRTSPDAAYDPSKYPFLKRDINFIVSGNLHLIKGLYGNIRFQYSVIPIRKNVDYEFARAHQYNNLWVIRLMYLF